MHPHGLVSLTEEVNAALSTLAAGATLDLDIALASLETDFLLKRVRYFLQVENLVPSEGPLLIGVAFGNTSIAESALGMKITNTVGPHDVTQSLGQDEAWKIIRASLEMLRWDGEGVGDMISRGTWHKMPGKGIPCPSGTSIGGLRVFIYNADTAALADTNTAIVKGIIEYQGVWLNG